MAVLIDASIFIAVERRGLPPEHAIRLVSAEAAALAGITASELLAGVHRADSQDRRLRRETFVEAILTALPVLGFDLRVARVYAGLSAQLAAAGQPVGAHDLLIAATALADGSAVLTHNLRDFERVPGLVVRQPTW
jgi:predicted nucleic acid-binding protein